jgi:hypothetical protein
MDDHTFGYITKLTQKHIDIGWNFSKFHTLDINTREYKKTIMVLTLELGQSGQPKAKIPKKKANPKPKMLNNILTRGQNFQKYSNTRPKCPGQNMIWLVLKLCGPRSNIKPKTHLF